MIVRATYQDSMTGESETVDIQINEVNGEYVRQALEQHIGAGTDENPSFSVEAFVFDADKTTASFILRETSTGAYGGYLVVGIIYPTFI